MSNTIELYDTDNQPQTGDALDGDLRAAQSRTVHRPQKPIDTPPATAWGNPFRYPKIKEERSEFDRRYQNPRGHHVATSEDAMTNQEIPSTLYRVWCPDECEEERADEITASPYPHEYKYFRPEQDAAREWCDTHATHKIDEYHQGFELNVRHVPTGKLWRFEIGVEYDPSFFIKQEIIEKSEPT